LPLASIAGFLTVEGVMNGRNKPGWEARLEELLATLDHVIASLRSLRERWKPDEASSPPADAVDDGGAQAPDGPGQEDGVNP